MRLAFADRSYLRNEAVPAPRNGADELRRSRIVSKPLPELRYGLCEGVLGHIGAGPQGVQQLFLGDQSGWSLQEVEQQIEELWRKSNWFRPAGNTIGHEIEPESAELVARSRHRAGV